jgi:hypothetical protein
MNRALTLYDGVKMLLETNFNSKPIKGNDDFGVASSLATFSLNIGEAIGVAILRSIQSRFIGL